jgi:hypothetical protein
MIAVRSRGTLFAVDMITKDQVENYAVCKGMPLPQVERWLARIWRTGAPRRRAWPGAKRSTDAATGSRKSSRRLMPFRFHVTIST